MRGEVLSSVELVLPSAVVDTCYNIKRDGQARFRAVNNEEKTKSEITVEKQEDDSVKIHVLVLSLTNLTDAELSEEVGLDLPNKENTQRRPSLRGRRGIRRRGGLGFSRKPKAATKRRLSLQASVESVEAGLNETVSEQVLDTSSSETKGDQVKTVQPEVAVSQEINPEDTESKEDRQSEATSKEDSQSVAVPPHSKFRRGKGVFRRGGRGRKGRGFGNRRGIGKGLTTPRPVSEPVEQLENPAFESASEELKETTSHEEPVVEKAEEVSQCEGILSVAEATLSFDEVPAPETESNSAILKVKSKRIRRNTDRSNVSETEGTSPKGGRPKRKVTQKSEEKPDASPQITENPDPSKEFSNAAEEKSATKGAVEEKKGTLCKRRIVSPQRLSDNDNTQEDNTNKAKDKPAEETVSSPNTSDQIVSVTEEGQSAENKEQVTAPPPKGKTVKGRPKAKKAKRSPAAPVNNAAESEPSQQYVDEGVQSQAAADVPPENLDKGPQDVKAVPGPKRKGRKPKVKRQIGVTRKVQQQLVPAEVRPNDSPIEPFRVKTKAQLKQKPLELDNFSDNDADAPSHNKFNESIRIEHITDTSTPKSISKKPIKKPKTLARIWRTRKKSGFTRKKKSKTKADNAGLISDSEIIAEHVDKTTPDIIETALKAADIQPLDASNEPGTEPYEPESLPEVQKEQSAENNEQESQNEIKDADNNGMPTLVNAQLDQNRKLPQKKRHTAKLAAERQQVADHAQITTNSENVVGVDQEEPSKQSKLTRNKQSAAAIGLQDNCEAQPQDTVVSLDVSLDLYNTCTDFNETNAIESLIQLSNATDESFKGPTRVSSQDPDDLQPEQNLTPVNGLQSLEPPVLQRETQQGTSRTDEGSLSENPQAAIEDITELSSEPSNDVIQQLMKIATESKSESSEDAQQGRPGKRAYKREFKVQCRFCDVKVKDYGYLFRHIKKLHSDRGAEMKKHLEEIRPLMRTPCPICHKMVSSISNISSHIKQCHATKDSAVLCPICKKTYKTTVSLRQHLRQCHQPQQHRFYCHLCSANFTEKRSLKEHINCSHETTQVFQCDDCGKSFLTKGRLRRHKYIHGDFRHKCNYCNKGFHLKDNMNKHIEIVHEKTQGKRFSCPHCDKKFTVKGNMTQHVMGVHLKQFQYTCPQCDTGFRRKKDMLSHMMKHGEGEIPDNPTSSMMSEEESSRDSEMEVDLKSGESPWHGSGEKTEVITGISGDPTKGSTAGGKTKVIIISPLAGYPSS